jgi:hypothetical protein
MEAVKYFQLAHNLNQEHRTTLIRRDLIFRGNAGSISLVSTAHASPLLGLSNLTAANLRYVTELLSKGKEFSFEPPGRPTPEKVLQASILRFALKNVRFPFAHDVSYMTNEIRVPYNGKTVLADLLGIDDNGTLVVIELKSKRLKSKLIAQIETFFNAIEDKRDFFQELVSIYGKEWTGAVKGIVVWPHKAEHWHTWPAPITEVCYPETFIDGRRIPLLNSQLEVDYIYPPIL